MEIDNKRPLEPVAEHERAPNPPSKRHRRVAPADFDNNYGIPEQLHARSACITYQNEALFTGSDSDIGLALMGARAKLDDAVSLCLLRGADRGQLIAAYDKMRDIQVHLDMALFLTRKSSGGGAEEKKKD